MGWNSEHKARTRATILRTAARLFTCRGFDAVSIDDVMKAAGLTRGAFYAHFNSKSELYAEAIVSAALAAQAQVAAPLPPNPGIGELASRYLSPEHRRGFGDSCPLAFLTTDIHQRDDQVRAAYTRVFRGFVQLMEKAGGKEENFNALRTAVIMIGGLAIARALDDEALSDELLQVCRQACRP